MILSPVFCISLKKQTAGCSILIILIVSASTIDFLSVKVRGASQKCKFIFIRDFSLEQ